MRPPRLLLHIPAHILNGMAVALGVAMVQVVIGEVGGFVPALTASSGAILASLADTPLPPDRTRGGCSPLPWSAAPPASW